MKIDFSQNIIDLQLYDEQFQHILDEYVPAYVNEKMVPAEETYRDIFGEINENIDEINSHLFVKTNNIQKMRIIRLSLYLVLHIMLCSSLSS